MQNKLKILYVSHYPHMRMGGQRSMSFLIEHLNREKFTPYAVCPEPGPLSDHLESLGCPCFFIPMNNMKIKNVHRLPTELFQLRKIIKFRNIDIIHPDTPADVFMCGLAKKGTPAKMVWHVRMTKSKKNDRLHFSMSDGVIGVSDGAGRRFRKFKKFSEKYKTIYNPVDCTVFKPAEDKNTVRQKLGLPADRFILVFVGVFKEGKGVYDLTEAAGILNGHLKSTEMPLILFIGTAPSEEKKKLLVQSIARSGAAKHIQLIGQQTNIHEWMQAADALVIPSHEGHEGMPRVLYEAMACGTAGIGSNTSGVNEAITENSGILVEEKSPRSIAEAVIRLIRDEKLLKTLQVNGRQRALDFFDVLHHARQVEEFYFKTLTKSEK